MARPRKNSSTPEAKTRIIKAFWTLLEKNNLSEITVSMIVALAQCNRGTFYYHFTDMNNLITEAIKSEIIFNARLDLDVFKLISGIAAVENENFIQAINHKRFAHMNLIVRKGGRDLAQDCMFSLLLSTWEAILSVDGSSLKPASRLVIRYVVCGMISFIENIDEITKTEQDIKEAATALVNIASTSLECLGQLQGISRDEIMERVRMLGAFSQVTA